MAINDDEKAEKVVAEMRAEPFGGAYPGREYESRGWWPGFSKLEAYALAAMQAIIACYSGDGVPLPPDKDVAKWAVDYAVALLAEIERRTKPEPLNVDGSNF